jgi:hypothetical protein
MILMKKNLLKFLCDMLMFAMSIMWLHICDSPIADASSYTFYTCSMYLTFIFYLPTCVHMVNFAWKVKIFDLL